MRPVALIITLLAQGIATSLGAQESGRWELHFELSRDAFTGASSDTTTIPGTDVEVAPAPRLAFEAGLDRKLGAWTISVAGGYASGGLRAKTPALLLDDRAGGVTRYRTALLVHRRVLRMGVADLTLLAGPALDHWSSTGIGDHTIVSGRVGVSVRIPLGALTLENIAALGVSGSPFRRRDLPAGTQVQPLRTWSFGAGLRLQL